MEMFKRLLMDCYKVGVLMGLVGWGLYLLDPSNIVVFQAMGIGIFLVGGTHLTRRILFNKIDLQRIALEAINDHNVAAAIVFSAFMAFLIAVMWISSQVFK